jgi:His-Xaa-Ser system radical SAM maturase HxsC
MLAKRTAAQVLNAPSPKIGKVVGLRDLATGATPIDRSILDLRGVPAELLSDRLLALPWAGYIADDSDDQRVKASGHPTIMGLGEDRVVAEGDVVRFATQTRHVDILYRRGANSNALFVTERCDNFCVMCSQPPRAVDDGWRIRELQQIVPLVDRSERWLGVTGGEPTLLGNELFTLIRQCGESLPETGIHVLSNGRRFADRSFADGTRLLHRELTWGIPLYGDVAHLHDYVVQRKGAFAETVRGLYHLARADQSIEIRVVLVAATVARLPELARYIAWNFPFAMHVALMGIEPQGFALANHGQVWIDPADFAGELQDAVATLHNAGLRASLYNLPLCVLPRTLWPFARQSISDWKNTYLGECSRCSVREQCCGVFSSVRAGWVSRAIHAVAAESEGSSYADLVA